MSNDGQKQRRNSSGVRVWDLKTAPLQRKQKRERFLEAIIRVICNERGECPRKELWSDKQKGKEACKSGRADKERGITPATEADSHKLPAKWELLTLVWVVPFCLPREWEALTVCHGGKVKKCIVSDICVIEKILWENIYCESKCNSFQVYYTSSASASEMR